jgi:MoxR-like ATPase
MFTGINGPSSPFERQETERIVEDAVFVRRQDKYGNPLGWQSSAPGRKAIELDPSSPEPEAGKKYRVRIIKDTSPTSPHQGKLIGVLASKKGRGLSTAEWDIVEDTLDQAETARRTGERASHELRRLTGVSKTERTPETAGKLKGAAARIADTALAREQAAELEVMAILGEDTESPGAKLLKLRTQEFIAAFKEKRKLEQELAQERAVESELLASTEDEPSGALLDALDEVRGKIERLKTEINRLPESSPEAFYGIHLQELENFKSALDRGEIVETDYVAEKAQDIVDHVRAHKPVMIYGHLGSGKTELAMHVARKYLGKEALVLSGSKHTSLAEIYGHQILAIDKLDKSELDSFINEVEGKFQTWLDDHAQASDQERNLAHDRILQTYLTRLKGGTVSDFFLGPIYRAMEEGRPIILDEVNAIPHEVLISLNHVLTRKPGDVINVQQDSGRKITIREGFCVIMTGNLNQGQERYVDRQDMDPAFLSRLHKVDYDYLPQATEGEISEAPKVPNELFKLLLARTMDPHGNLEAPTDTPKKLWRLAQAARVIQNVFAGREVKGAEFLQGRDLKLVYFLKESVLSMRALDNILTQWQREGYRRELDYYLYAEFVAQSTNQADRAYLYQLLKDRFGFFTSEGWEQNPNYGQGGNVTAFEIVPPKNKPAQRIFTGPRGTVKLAFGQAPRRKRYPDVEIEDIEEEPPPSPKPRAQSPELAPPPVESAIDFEASEASDVELLARMPFANNPTLAEIIAERLVGYDSDSAWQLRESLSSVINRTEILKGIAGLDSTRSWQERGLKINLFAPPWEAIAMSLAGVDSPRAWEVRDQMAASSAIEPRILAISVTGLDTKNAWNIREKALKIDSSEKTAIAVLQSITCLDSLRAWQMRKRLAKMNKRVKTEACFSCRGLNGEDADMLCQNVWRGLFNDDSPQVGDESDTAWNARMANLKFNPSQVAQSLVGCRSLKADLLRQKLLDEDDEYTEIPTNVIQGTNLDWKLIALLKKNNAPASGASAQPTPPPAPVAQPRGLTFSEAMEERHKRNSP